MERPKPFDLYRGIRALEIVIDKDGNEHNLCIEEKCLLLTLATYADADGGNIYPGIQLLMRNVHLRKTATYGWLKKLKEYGLLVRDGRHGYTRRFRLNIPGTTPIASQPAAPGADISQEEWENMMRPDEDDDATEMRMPAVKPPPAAPPAAPPEPPDIPTTPPVSPEEKYQQNLDFIWYCIGMVRQKKAGMTYEKVLKEAARKGIPRDEVDWLWEQDIGGQTGSSEGHQPADEPVTANEMIPEARHQTGMYQS